MSKAGNMKTISEIQTIINDTYTFIPLLQRNYKWSRECAAELAEDLWQAFKANKPSYQLNMITIYKNEENNTLQILDGQQRMITLKLLLAIVSPGKNYLNYDFERDYFIDQRAGRRYFINYVLPEIENIERSQLTSVDIMRLFDNYNSMRVPLSFKTIYEYYSNLLKQKKEFVEENVNNGLENTFVENFDTTVVNSLEKILTKEFCSKISFTEEEIKNIYKWCEEFQKRITNLKTEEEVSDDEIRVSKFSDDFQELWTKKILSVCETGSKKIIEYSNPDGLAKFIMEKVEMLYHETSSEPIDEFLNINENKTRFVISDYIRAYMISDNPIDGDKISAEEKEKNREKRKKTLQLFSKISKYLYDEKYNLIWKLVRTRYDDFEKYPDINRMKVIFADKYVGTSTKNYKFEEELERLSYFAEILDVLCVELNIDDDKTEQDWNTYNAVYMLLECKEKYRFFSLFTPDDIQKKNCLSDVTAREKFCFFEEAYKRSMSREDPWDLSYFLESQLYTNECDLKKRKREHLPDIEELNDGSLYDPFWVNMNRGNKDDDLSNCLKKMIENYKRR